MGAEDRCTALNPRTDASPAVVAMRICLLTCLPLCSLPVPLSPGLPSPSRVPYHRAYLNITEAFLYSWCWYASGLALIGVYYPAVRGGRATEGAVRRGLLWRSVAHLCRWAGSLSEAAVLPPLLPPQHWPRLTLAFLAGMAPVGVAFGALSHLRLRRMWRMALTFEQWTPQTPRREVHRFLDAEECEVVARWVCWGGGEAGLGGGDIANVACMCAGCHTLLYRPHMLVPSALPPPLPRLPQGVPQAHGDRHPGPSAHPAVGAVRGQRAASRPGPVPRLGLPQHSAGGDGGGIGSSA